MAWAEAHMAVGAGVYALAHMANGGDPATHQVAAAVVVSCLSHWPMDDLNVGEQMVYHGWGENIVTRALTTLFRVPVWAALIFLFYRYPESMVCALPAWLILDHEWFLNIVGRHGYGLHQRMWFKWLKTQWGLIPWLVAFALIFLMIV